MANNQDISIKQLVEKVTAGELTLPEMQRRYVWTAVKVRDLFDSLYHGYPSGSILAWETDNSINDRNLQVNDVSASLLTNKLLLLDGQQRLTSLTAVIKGKELKVRNKTKALEILFNLDHPDNIFDQEDNFNDENEEQDFDEDEDSEDEEENDLIEELKKKTFVVESKRLKNDPKWISVSDIFKKSDSQLLKPLGISLDDPNWDKYTERIKNVKKIEDYQYRVQVLPKSMSYQEVTEIFVRVNSLGVKLRGSDLALAQITSRWKGFLNELELFAGEFKDNSDYLIESGILVKSMVVFATGQSQYKTISKIPINELIAAWDKTKASMRYAINFITANIRIDNLRLMGSPFLLIPISYFASLKNERLTSKEEKQILLWFYTAHMKGHYSYGASEGYLDADINSITKTKSLDDLLAILKAHVKSFEVTEDDIKGKSTRSPYFSMLFFITKQKGVLDWLSGIAITENSKGKAHAVQFHHIFPKAQLKKLSIDKNEINDLANLTFIVGRTNRNISDKKPIDYIPEIVSTRGNDVFKNNYITEDKTLWELENYKMFLKDRREKLATVLNNFVANLQNIN